MSVKGAASLVMAILLVTSIFSGVVVVTQPLTSTHSGVATATESGQTVVNTTLRDGGTGTRTKNYTPAVDIVPQKNISYITIHLLTQYVDTISIVRQSDGKVITERSVTGNDAEYGHVNYTLKVSLSNQTEYRVITENKDGNVTYSYENSDLPKSSPNGNIQNAWLQASGETTYYVYGISAIGFGKPDNLGDIVTSSGTGLNGTVRDQSGDPVANATVVGWGVDYSNISASGAQSKEEKARELIQESKNVRPKSFDADLQLAGSEGKLSKTGERYVAVHTAGDWALRGVDPGGTRSSSSARGTRRRLD